MIQELLLDAIAENILTFKIDLSIDTQVTTSASVKIIAPWPPIKQIVAAASDEEIVALKPTDYVPALEANDQVIAFRTSNYIITECSHEQSEVRPAIK